MATIKPQRETGKDLVRRFWVDVFNQGDGRAVTQIFDTNYRLRDHSTGGSLDLRSLKDLVDGLHDNLSKPQAEIVEQFMAEGDRVVTRLVFRARPLGDDANYDAPAEISGIAIDRIVNGRVESTDLMWDAWTADSTLRPDDILNWRFPWW